MPGSARVFLKVFTVTDTSASESDSTVEKPAPVQAKPPFAHFLEAPPTLAFLADKKKARAKSDLYEMVERRRIELPTSALRTQRSPS